MFAISHIRAVHGLKRTYKYEWPTWPKDNTRSSPFIKKLAANDWLKELGRRTDELPFPDPDPDQRLDQYKKCVKSMQSECRYLGGGGHHCLRRAK